MRLIGESRKRNILKATFSKPYFFSFFIIFLGYIFLNFFLNELSFSYILNLTPWFSVLFFLFSFLIVPGLVALNINLLIIRFKKQKKISKSGSFSFLGAFGGFLGGACPGCFAGVFSSIFGIFGITVTLGVLPFYGLEIQFISSAILLVSVFLLTRENVCKVKF